MRGAVWDRLAVWDAYVAHIKKDAWEVWGVTQIR